MRARLTKKQMQMLLDGRTLRPYDGTHREFGLPGGESETRTILQNLVNSEELREKFAVFIDMNDHMIVVEEKK